MRALALRCQLAPDQGTYTVLIPLEKSEGKNELVGQNEVDQRREHIVNVSKVRTPHRIVLAVSKY